MRRLILVLVLLGTWCAPIGAQGSRTGVQPPPAASSLFGFIDLLASNDADLDPAAFQATLKREGFRKDEGPGALLDVWRLTRPDGEVRVIPTFQTDAVSVSLMYFPAVPQRIPDSALTWMLSKGTYVQLNDGDELVIGIADRRLGVRAGRTGHKVEEVTVSLNGGALIKTRVVIEWSGETVVPRP